MGGGGPAKTVGDIAIGTIAGVPGIIGKQFAEKKVEEAMHPNIPTLQLPGEAPTPTNPETAAAVEEAQAKQRKPRGRAATLLTGGQGVSDSGLSISRRTLLGS